MYVDQETGSCAFNYATLVPKGGCNFNIYFKGIQDDEDMWWLWLHIDETEAQAERWLNLGNPHHTIRNTRV